MNETFCFLELEADGTKKVKLGNKLVGTISGKTFDKKVRGSRHMLFKVPGWATEVDVLEVLDEEGVEVIKITDIETGQVYEATMMDFQRNGVRHYHPNYGPQLCLPLSFWKITSSNEVKKE